MKKIAIITFYAFLMTLSVNAQLLGSLKMDPKEFSTPTFSDSSVYKSIKGSVVVVRQSYQVRNRKTGKVYGRNGRADFGHHYSLGIRTEAGLVLTDGAIKPWEYDPSFKKVAQDYEPVISLTEIRDVESDGDVKFKQCPLQLERPQPDGAWIANAKDIVPQAIEIDLSGGNKDGWLIWFTAKKNLDNTPESEIAIRANSKKIEAGNGDEDVNYTSDSDMVLGGMYICPIYLGGGHIINKLVGIVVKDDKQWKLRTPFVDFFIEKPSDNQSTKEETPSIEETENTESEEMELTPIEKDKKESKKNKK